MMTATLPADLEPFVKTMIESGYCTTPDQVVAAGLQLLRERHEELRALVKAGIDQIERGEVEPFDPVAEYEELTAELSRKEVDAASDSKRTREVRLPGDLAVLEESL